MVFFPRLRRSLRSAGLLALLAFRLAGSLFNAAPSLGIRASASSGCACSLPAALIRAAPLGFVAGSLWVAPPCPSGSLGVLPPPLFGRSLCSLFFFFCYATLRFASQGCTSGGGAFSTSTNSKNNKACKIRQADFFKVTMADFRCSAKTFLLSILL